MDSDGGSGSDTSTDTREMGVEFGQLKEKLESHEYPTTGDELVGEYGDFELELPGGSETLREILGKRRGEDGDSEDIQFESADEVHQSILNMVDSKAVGRQGYSDRGGSLQGEFPEEEDGNVDSI
jgi:hypothetical protein